jgi:hypothetical protein
MVELGQRVLCRPVSFGYPELHKARGEESHPIRTGSVFYIHPKHRYIGVAIEERGGVIRECFKPYEINSTKNWRRKR